MQKYWTFLIQTFLIIMKGDLLQDCWICAGSSYLLHFWYKWCNIFTKAHQIHIATYYFVFQIHLIHTLEILAILGIFTCNCWRINYKHVHVFPKLKCKGRDPWHWGALLFPGPLVRNYYAYCLRHSKVTAAVSVVQQLLWQASQLSFDCGWCVKLK